MATAIKKCRVCGNSYEACHTVKHIAGTFRWQEVACSPECGSIYLARIEESRKVNPIKIDNDKIIEELDIIEIEDNEEDNDEEPFEELNEYFDVEDDDAE